MALIFMESFEDVSSLAYKWSAITDNPTMTAVAGRNGGNAGRFAALNDRMTYIVPAADEDDRFVLGFALYLTTGNNGVGIVALCSDNGATDHIGLRVDSTPSPPNITLRRGGMLTTGTVLYTLPADMAFNTWYYFEIDCTLADSGGTIKLYRDGVLLYSNTNADTKNAGTKTVFDSIILNGITTNATVFDDLYLLNGAAGLTEPLGEIDIECLHPNGNGNYSQLVGSDGNSTDNYLLVDETAISTADYVESDTAGDKDTYAYQDLVATTGVIRGVQHTTFAAKVGGAARSIKGIARVSATDYDGTEKVLGYGHRGTISMWENNPNTATAWVHAGVNGAEFGSEVV
jgi:hypothetical protein